MSRRKSVTVGSQAASSWIPLDPMGTQDYVVTVVVSAGGSLTYSVQYTNDDIWAGAPTNIHEHDTITAKTATFTGNIEYVPMAIRLNVYSYSSGSATMQIVPGTGV
jgi:hypothetical protein